MTFMTTLQTANGGSRNDGTASESISPSGNYGPMVRMDYGRSGPRGLERQPGVRFHREQRAAKIALYARERPGAVGFEPKHVSKQVRVTGDTAYCRAALPTV